ncbi:MAG: MiaB/RimO family radical SAM methylthiotransferase [Candidatus Moranbacteria bacterium]|nr:MiaB/RimO family radical SAM methylthiotransferase [Candidatus Moranbacteria bacterium]
MKNVFLKTFGCQMNFSDTERITNQLIQSDYQLKSDFESADLVIINTCGVRETAENRAMSLAHKIRRQKPKVKIIITGCLANRPDIQKKIGAKADLFLGIQQLFFYLKPAKQCPESQTGQSNNSDSYLAIQPKYQHNRQILVPIMTGCNNFCSYCVVPYARGREFSRSKAQISAEIAQAVKQQDLQSVVLLGQNVNSYRDPNNETGFGFPELLAKLARTYPKIKFSFLTSHPKDFSQNLIRVIKSNPNVSRSIHLPVQAGSDKILKAMNRPYTKKQYLSLVAEIKKQLPDVILSTDVIVGFPGETRADFSQTIDIFKRAGFHSAYINKYSPRPGTAAYKLQDPISQKEKRRREQVLKQTLERIKA